MALDILNLGAGTLTNQPVLAGRGVDGMVAAQEDAQRELKCRQALLSVHAFENGCHIDAQVGSDCNAVHNIICHVYHLETMLCVDLDMAASGQLGANGGLWRMCVACASTRMQMHSSAKVL